MFHDFEQKDDENFFINSKIYLMEKNYNRALKLIINGMDLFKDSPYLLGVACEVFFEMEKTIIFKKSQKLKAKVPNPTPPIP